MNINASLSGSATTAGRHPLLAVAKSILYYSAFPHRAYQPLRRSILAVYKT